MSYIAIDFDGTCLTHDYPEIGKDIGAAPVLLELIGFGHKLILHTMRGGNEEREAVRWFNDNGIQLYATGKNPHQSQWTSSNKTYAHLYIDDAALGCPLIIDIEKSDRPFVDWIKVRKMLVKHGYLPKPPRKGKSRA